MDPRSNITINSAGLAYWQMNAMGFTPDDDSRIGSRSFVKDLLYDCEWSSFREEVMAIWARLGYTKYKLTQLKRVYQDPDRFLLLHQRLQRRLSKRKFFTIGMNFGTGSKTDVDQSGECMSGLGLYGFPCKDPDGKKAMSIRVKIFWRATEGVRRFPADLRFVLLMLDELSSLKQTSKISWWFDSIQLFIGFAYFNIWAYPLWVQMFPGMSERINKRVGWGRRLNNAFKEAKTFATGRGKDTIKYKPHRRLLRAYRENQESELPALFTASNRAVRVHTGRRKPTKPAGAGGRSPRKKRRRS